MIAAKFPREIHSIGCSGPGAACCSDPNRQSLSVRPSSTRHHIAQISRNYRKPGPPDAGIVVRRCDCIAAFAV